MGSEICCKSAAPMTAAALLVKLLDGTTHLLTTSSPGNAALRVQDILAKYAPASEIDSICLSCNGKPVESDEDLACLSPMSVMQMSVAAAGGKVHGQLHKAGKVRQQTPKVEKKTQKEACVQTGLHPKAACCAPGTGQNRQIWWPGMKSWKKSYVRVSVCVHTTLLKK